MSDDEPNNLARYRRQVAFEGLGLSGQRALMGGVALVVGVGGLGACLAELLARAGVGSLRLIDDDRVDLTNIHRQVMYDEADAADRTPKALAAAAHLARINASVAVEPIVARLDKGNIAELARGVDVILDGTDSFPTRFILNDYSVREGVPWVFAGVVGAEAQTMTIVPGQTACLRCVYDRPPPPCVDPTCRSAGVLAPAVTAVASIQAMEAMKILAGRRDRVSPYLLKLDLWANRVQRVDAAAAAAVGRCCCCKDGVFEFLD